MNTNFWAIVMCACVCVEVVRTLLAAGEVVIKDMPSSIPKHAPEIENVCMLDHRPNRARVTPGMESIRPCRFPWIHPFFSQIPLQTTAITVPKAIPPRHWG